MVGDSGERGCRCVSDGRGQGAGGFCLGDDFIDIFAGSALRNAYDKGIPERDFRIVEGVYAWRGQTTGEACGDVPEVFCVSMRVVRCPSFVSVPIHGCPIF